MAFEEFGSSSFESEEREPIQMTQEDYDKFRVLAAEEPHSSELSAMLEQYGLEAFDGESVDVMVGGQVTELEGFRHMEKPEMPEDMEDEDMDDMEMAA